jgi:hypothetical protein
MTTKRGRAGYPAIPAFRSEREEAVWWDAHPEVALRILKQARRDGSITRGEVLRRVRQKPSVLVSMRIPVADVEQAKEIAGRKGLPYQTYLKSLIRQGLRRDEKAG